MTEVSGRSWKTISLITIPAMIIVGDVIGYLSNSGFRNPWFASLVKPFLMPPAWVFGLVWNALYALMAIALAMVLAESPSSRRNFALTLFFVQLALNYAWSPIFFAGHDIGLAKVVIFVTADSCGGSWPVHAHSKGCRVDPDPLSWLARLRRNVEFDDRQSQSRCGQIHSRLIVGDRKNRVGDSLGPEGGGLRRKTLFSSQKEGTGEYAV